MLDNDKLRAIAERLDNFDQWASDVWTEVEYGVTVTQDEYYVDLGEFGEQTMYVEASDDYYPIRVAQIVEHAPESISALRDELNELINAEPEQASLETALMELRESLAEDERALGRVLTAVADAFRGFPAGLSSVSVGALPEKPLPWPGAMLDEIDYTADDFPLRYQPPPGYVWTKPGGSVPVPHDETAKRDCATLRNSRERGEMVLDSKGRVSWLRRGDDSLDDDRGRWPLWFHERVGIPRATGSFSLTTEPLPIDADGRVIGEWKDSNGHTTVWGHSGSDGVALARVAEIRAEFEGAPPKKKSEFAPPEPVTL